MATTCGCAYRTIPAALANSYRSGITQLVLEGNSPTMRAARDELVTALDGLLGRAPSVGQQ
jgi:alpha-glucuronidase